MATPQPIDFTDDPAPVREVLRLLDNGPGRDPMTPLPIRSTGTHGYCVLARRHDSYATSDRGPTDPTAIAAERYPSLAHYLPPSDW